MFIHPAPGFIFGDRYGARPSTTAGGYTTSTMHGGLDLIPPKGGSRNVVAAADGVIVPHPYGPTAGNAICIWHPELRLWTGYAHLDTRLLGVGAEVEAGRTIAVAGSTGASTGTHLHWDVFTDLDRFVRIDPYPLIRAKSTAPAPVPAPTPIRRLPAMFLVQLNTGPDKGKIFLVTANGWAHVPDMTVLGLFQTLIKDGGGTGKVTEIADYAAVRMMQTVQAAA